MTIRTSAPPPHAEYFPSPRAAHAPARWLAALADERRQLVRFWPVVQNLVVQELRVRYQRSVLGFLWTLLNPILMMGTLTLIFSKVFNVPNPRDYAVYLFAGLVPWTFFSIVLNDCAFCIIFNESLIRKIYLPKLIFPLARVLINLTTFVLSMAALFVLLKLIGAHFHLTLVLLPVAVLLFAAFALGLGLIVATMNTFYRDCGHLVAVILQAWYFATPILYKPADLPGLADVRWRFWLNPAYPFIKLFQDIISDGRWPELFTITAAAGIAAVSLGVGYAAFKCYEDKLVFRL
jgi:ABC-2 type transport system permease protein/lipopolysaccharide transport system permease protein